MTAEVGNRPVVNVVWYIQLCHLIQKCTVEHVVKGFTKVGYDDYIRACGQKPRDQGYVVVNFDMGERFPRPRSQQRGSLHPRARRVAVLGWVREGVAPSR